jgi:hypothetical protein
MRPVWGGCSSRPRVSIMLMSKAGIFSLQTGVMEYNVYTMTSGSVEYKNPPERQQVFSKPSTWSTGQFKVSFYLCRNPVISRFPVKPFRLSILLVPGTYYIPAISLIIISRLLYLY